MARTGTQPPPEGSYELGATLYRQKAYAAACEAYQRWLDEHPDDARALGALAVCRAAAGGRAQQDAALALARRAIQLAPADARLRATLARLYEKAERWAEAADTYERACEKEPSSVQVMGAQGGQGRQGVGAKLRYTRTVAPLCSAPACRTLCGRFCGPSTQHQPRRRSHAPPQFLLDWARALKEVGRPARAADAYARAVELAPTHPRAHFKLAMALRQAGRRERAAEHFRWGAARGAARGATCGWSGRAGAAPWPRAGTTYVGAPRRGPRAVWAGLLPHPDSPNTSRPTPKPPPPHKPYQGATWRSTPATRPRASGSPQPPAAAQRPPRARRPWWRGCLMSTRTSLMPTWSARCSTGRRSCCGTGAPAGAGVWE